MKNVSDDEFDCATDSDEENKTFERSQNKEKDDKTID